MLGYLRSFTSSIKRSYLNRNAATMPTEEYLQAKFQEIFSFGSSDQTWISQTPTASSPFALTGGTTVPAHFHLITWNVDFAAPYPLLRMTKLLSYLEELFTSRPELSPAVILLQEVNMSCFHALLPNEFVRRSFDVTNINPDAWPSYSTYGTVTLISKVLNKSVASVFRTPYPGSRMDRDALYVDLLFHGIKDNNDIGFADDEAASGKIVRIANTHLESLRGHGEVERPKQLESVMQYLTAPGIHCGLVGGDMNAITPKDEGVPHEIGFRDAWVEEKAEKQKVEENRGHSSDNEAEPDMTWGYQPPCSYPPGRLDKILLTGNVKVEQIERLGVGLKYTWSNDRGDVDEEWVSDHYGLLTKVIVS